MRKKIIVEENAGEYYQMIKVKCDSFQQIGKNVLVINGASIEFDEDIVRCSDLPDQEGNKDIEAKE